jgi:hypothetical protein
MIKLNMETLLRDQRVVQEINRYRWLESEICGYDIGFAKAVNDWMARFSIDWIKYHLPRQLKKRSAKKFRSLGSIAKAKNILKSRDLLSSKKPHVQ